MRYEESGDGYSNIVQWGYDDENNLSSQTQTLNGTTYTSTYAYDKDNRLTKATEGAISANYAYDSFSRMSGLTVKNGSSPVVSTAVTYVDPSSSATSTQVKTWNNGKTTYTYSYNSKGNISYISDGSLELDYRYDEYGRLTRVECLSSGYTLLYHYDVGGNLTRREKIDPNQDRPRSTIATYTCGDANWPDLLTAYNGKSITYDAIGNPLNDGTWTYAWQHGRQLASMSKSGSSITYGYNADGKRISKTINGTTYNYAYLGDTLTDLSWGSNRMHFTYDSLGPASVTYNSVKYFYLKNAQGDVTGLVNASGTQVVSYTYDPWGAPLSTDGTMASTLGAANPLRYRGYVYDTETGLYYLSSRYYNPTWGRFINADGYASTGQGFTGDNMFAYCNDNPVNYNDSEGTYPLRNTMTMMTDTGGNTPKPKYSAAIPIGTGTTSSAVNAVAEQTLKPKVVPVPDTALKEGKNFGPLPKALKSSKVVSAAFALPFTIASIISDFKHYEGLGVALSVFVDILNPVICIMIGGILAANLYAFPAMLAATLFGTLVDFGCYFFKEQCLKAYKKKGKT